MAGTYVHFMAAEKARDAITGDSAISKSYLLDLYWPFVIAGSVAPDYPYLVLTSGDAHEWAGRMHHTRTRDTLRAGFSTLRSTMDADERDIAAAWMLGYLSHVITDVVVHPIVNRIVGPYEQNKKAHRLCEMTQDSQIFMEVKGVEITEGEYIDHLRDISDPADSNKIHPVVERQWQMMLKDVHQDFYDGTNLDINGWQGSYISKLDTVDERIIFANIRRFVEDEALFYRRSTEIPDGDREKYIKSVPLPGGGAQPYMDVFEKAANKVEEGWRTVLTDLVSAPDTGGMGGAGALMADDWVKDWSLDKGIILGEDDDAIPYFWA